MRKMIILLGLFFFFPATADMHAAELRTKPPIRDIIDSLDHWIRKDWTLEKHIRNECEAYEFWKLPRGHKWLRHFKLVSVKQIGEFYFVVATYECNEIQREVTATVFRKDEVWINREFSIDYHEKS